MLISAAIPRRRVLRSKDAFTLEQFNTICVNAKFLLYFFRSHDNDLLSGHSISNGDFVPVKTFLKGFYADRI